MLDARRLDDIARAEVERPRLRLLLALGIDVLTLVVAALAAGVVATAWLLARTQAGSADVTAGDGAVALALYAAALPAWVAVQWYALLRAGRTPGARIAGLRPAPLPTGFAREAWLLLHPASTALWVWAAASAALLDAAPIAEALSALAAATTTLGVASLLLLLLRPHARPLHDAVARLLPGGRG